MNPNYSNTKHDYSSDNFHLCSGLSLFCFLSVTLQFIDPLESVGQTLVG